ncbi:GNAT family N-acetyltransferase [Chitinophaga flava]|uniref:GNAT family N-acetyltransferase n=1 Tax=Chitinophaga flava TaxID=2259036 RepID=A0A365XUH4_9BACT|nr:GNAT family N-acetyltransferase [Chitinophaga flava]RBL90017.1 GNAT family N-acetyltransferase [Chitinophaga flava]
MEHIDIITATNDQITLLQQLASQTFLETYAAHNTASDMETYLSKHFNPEQLALEINSPDSNYYIAFHQHTPIGYIKLNTGEAQTDIKKPDTLEIERIYVLQDYQGLKAGRQLLKHAITVARQLQVTYIWLGVWEKNEKALGFYHKHGFTPFGTHIFLLGADEQTDILMKLEPGNTL